MIKHDPHCVVAKQCKACRELSGSASFILLIIIIALGAQYGLFWGGVFYLLLPLSEDNVWPDVALRACAFISITLYSIAKL